MANLNIDINLLKLTNAGILTVKGKTATKKCVVIPIEENDIYVSVDEVGKPKAAYLHLTAWESKEEKYGQTHYVTQNLSQEYKDAHPEEERKPILGNGRRMQQQTNTNAVESLFAPNANIEDSDLPF